MLGEMLYHIGFDYLGITKLFIAMGFLILGAIIRDEEGIIAFKNKWCRCLAVPLLFTIWIVALLINGKISLYAVELGNYFLFLTAGICGSLCFMVMVKYLLANSRIANPVIRVGNNTILVVGTHYIFVTILGKLGGVLQISHTWVFSLVVLVTVPLIIAFYMPVSEYITKYLPVVNGKMKIK